MKFKTFIENTLIDLWLDDKRDPKDPKIQSLYKAHSDMVWVKTVPDAKKILETGQVGAISFDNDLGQPEEGKHLAKWIAEQASQNTIPPLQWSVHSDNYPAKQEIISWMRTAERFWNAG